MNDADIDMKINKICAYVDIMKAYCMHYEPDIEQIAYALLLVEHIEKLSKAVRSTI